ncbi:MAG: hypothetical protein M3Z75_06495 [Actinomycetota bacterium]|nr:hypothetical protein [Actinomycetota bacterium]
MNRTTQPGTCQYCGKPSYLTGTEGYAHSCCHAWRKVIAAGYTCPACQAGRWLASHQHRGASMPPLPRFLPDGSPFAPEITEET